MEDPDVTTSQELHLMQRMGLPTCFLNSPRDLDSDDEVCTAETHLIFHFYSFIALRHLNLKSDCVTIQMKPLPQDIACAFFSLQEVKGVLTLWRLYVLVQF